MQRLWQKKIYKSINQKQMNSFFTAKIKCLRQNEVGEFKRKSEMYLLPADNFTEAEARIHEEVGQYVKGEFIVTGMARTEVLDIFCYEDSDVWYKTTVAQQDPESEKEKITKHTVYVTASSVGEAEQRVQESMGTLADFEVYGATKTKIVEIFEPVAAE